MACSNGVMIRFVISAVPGSNCDNPAVGTASILSAAVATVAGYSNAVPSITKVNGLSLGEEGTIDVPDWDKKFTVADGKRALPQLDLQFRIDADLRAFTMFSSLFGVRAGATVDYTIAITKRDWSPMFFYKYFDCQMRSFVQEDQELGQSKLGVVNTLWSPADVKMLAADGSTVLVNN